MPWIISAIFDQVLIFELVEARTPFASPGSEQDMGQLFINIACVKNQGVEFPENFDGKAGGPQCRDVVSGMLAFEPGDRLGNLANGYDFLYLYIQLDILIMHTFVNLMAYDRVIHFVINN